MTLGANMEIAIIGAACRFPGGINSLENYWENLCSGADLVTEVPEKRFTTRAYTHPLRETPGKSVTFRAGVVDHVMDFDADFFGMAPREVASIDPQQRLALMLSYEALQSAGLTMRSLRGSDTAVFMGAASTDMAMMRADDPSVIAQYSMTGTNLSIISNRVSYFFDWHGPSMTMDTACSSSLVAVNQACACLQSGRTGLALAGGVNILLSPLPFIGFSHAYMLSEEGRCKVFSARADGYVRAEGGAVVLLKLLDRALADGDPILGVILRTEVNSDGRTVGIALPNLEAQKSLLQRIYAVPELDLRDLVYLEMHGTGTLVGDPIECESVGEVVGHRLKALCSRPLPIGSVKANIGHLETASGMAGLLKALLVLQHRRIPLTPVIGELNPQIDFAALNLKVVQANEDIAATEGAPLAGVNSFGFGGTNAHVLLRSPVPAATSASVSTSVGVSASTKAAPANLAGASLHQLGANSACVSALSEQAASGTASPEAPFELVVAAAGDFSLKAELKALAAQFDSGESLSPVQARTLCAAMRECRDDFPHRLALLALEPKTLVQLLKEAATGKDSEKAVGNTTGKVQGKASGITSGKDKLSLSGGAFAFGEGPQRRKIAFAFSGNGSQYAGMGRALYENVPVFRAEFDKVDAALLAFQDWSVKEALFGRLPLPQEAPSAAVPELGAGPVDTTAALLERTLYAQPLLFAFQVALAATLEYFGIKPACVCGHSLGEVAAACVSGALSLENACMLIARRAAVQEQTRGLGRMAAVRADPGCLEKMLSHPEFAALEIAGVNSRGSYTLSGPVAALKALAAALKPRHGVVRMLSIDYAFHSAAMDGVQEQIKEALRGLKCREGTVDFYSTVTGDRLAGTTLDSWYWWRNIRECVKFEDAVNAQLRDGADVFVEIGPAPVLLSYLRQNARAAEKDILCAALLRDKHDSSEDLLSGLASLFAGGVKPVGSAGKAAVPTLSPAAVRACACALPRYVWNLNYCWTGHSMECRHLFNQVQDGRYLGYREYPLSPLQRRAWLNNTDKYLFPELSGHEVLGEVLCPAAVFLEMALKAAQLSLGEQGKNGVELLNFAIEKPLSLEKLHSIRTETGPDGELSIAARIHSGDDEYLRRVKARFLPAAGENGSIGSVGADFHRLQTQGTEFAPEALYELSEGLGINYQGGFRSIERLYVLGRECLLKFKRCERAVADELFAPELADAALQGLFAFKLAAATALKTGSPAASGGAAVAASASTTAGIAPRSGAGAAIESVTKSSVQNTALGAARTAPAGGAGASAASVTGAKAAVSAAAVAESLVPTMQQALLDDTLYLPVFMDKVELSSDGSFIPEYALVRLEKMLPHSVCISFVLLDRQGEILLQASGCRYRKVPLRPENRAVLYTEHLRFLPPLCPGQACGCGTGGEFLRTLRNPSAAGTAAAGPRAAGTEVTGADAAGVQAAAAASEHEQEFTSLVQAYICAAFLELKPVRGVSTLAESLFDFILNPESFAYLHFLLEQLQAAGLARADGEDCYTLGTDEWPSAGKIFVELLHSFPEKINALKSLHACGLRLKEVFKEQQVTDKTASGAAAEFAFWLHSLPETLTLRAAVASALRHSCLNLEHGLCLKVLETGGLYRSAAAALPDLEKLNLKLYLYGLDAGNVQDRSRQRSGITFLDEAELAAQEHTFDLILDCAAFGSGIRTAGELKRCHALLKEGGELLGFEPLGTPLADFIAGASPEHWSLSVDEEHPRSAFLNAAAFAAAAQEAGFAPELQEYKELLCFSLKALPVSEMAGAGTAAATGAVATASAEAALAPAAAVEAGTLKLPPLQPFVLARCVSAAAAAPISALFGKDSACLAELQIPEGADVVVLPEAALQGVKHKGRAQLLLADFTGVMEPAAACATLGALIRAVAAAGSPCKSLKVVTAGAGGPVAACCASALKALLRVAANEYPSLNIFCLTLYDFSEATLQALRAEVALGTETELGLGQGQRCVYSVQPESRPACPQAAGHCAAGAAEGAGTSGCTGVRLQAPDTHLSSLVWQEFSLPELKPDEICIKTKAAGLNFRDVLYVQGLLPDEALERGFSGPGLGLECSGIVSAAGSQVTKFKPGDEVLAFGPGCLADTVITSEAAAAKKPQSLSFEAAASVPVTFFTAYYALIYVGRACRGESILIHGAAGGVGLAAVEIATALGLEIYATAGSDSKRSLLRSLGVRHIYNSRDLSFAARVLRDTRGEGVDLVLNSLYGQAALKSLGLLKPFGRFLELGKRDFYADNPLFLKAFKDNLSYHAIDVDELLGWRPKLAGEIFPKLLGELESGQLKLQPYTVYPALLAGRAFSDMRASAHTGKLVISLEGAAGLATLDSGATAVSGGAAVREASSSASISPLVLDPNRQVLLTGALGGLGFAVATELVRQGVSKLLLLGRRSAADAVVQEKLENLRLLLPRDRRGHLVYLSLDLARCTDAELETTLEAVLEPSLQGVVHCAGVLDDGMLSSLNFERFAKVFAPKYSAACTLFRVLDRHQIKADFEILFSSVAALLGSPGQGNYAAANAALEALATVRRAEGKNCCALSWGPVAGPGMLGSRPEVLRYLEKNLGTRAMQPSELLSVLFSAGRSTENLQCLKINWGRIAALKVSSSARFESVLAGVRSRGGAGVSSLALKLRETRDEQAALELICSYIGRQVASLMELSDQAVPLERKISELGMDSLMLMELASDLEQQLEIKVPPAAFSSGDTVRTLAARCLKLLRSGTAGAAADAQSDDSAMLSELESRHGVKLSADFERRVTAVSSQDLKD